MQEVDDQEILRVKIYREYLNSCSVIRENAKEQIN